MAAIDLRNINFKCFERGDSWTNATYGAGPSGSTTVLSLSAIKFRAHEAGEDSSDT